MSRPSTFAVVSASASATRCAVQRKLVSTFSIDAEPSSPVCRIWWPSIDSTGRARSNAARGPPAKIEMLPDAARWQPPDTGHSSVVAPLFRDPGRQAPDLGRIGRAHLEPDLAGPEALEQAVGPSTTAAEAAGEGRQVMTKSQASAISRGEAALFAPRMPQPSLH